MVTDSRGVRRSDLAPRPEELRKLRYQVTDSPADLEGDASGPESFFVAPTVALPFTMSRPRNAPLIELPVGAKCCDGIISVNAADLPFRQKLTPGTSAWRKSYRRRNVVEGVNAMLKGGFVNIQQKFFRVFGLTKLTFLLAFIISGGPGMRPGPSLSGTSSLSHQLSRPPLR